MTHLTLFILTGYKVIATVWNLQPIGQPTLATNQTVVSSVIRVGSASTLSSNPTIFFPYFLPIVTWNLTFIPPILVGHSFEGVNVTIDYGNGQSDILTTPPGKILIHLNEYSVQSELK